MFKMTYENEEFIHNLINYWEVSTINLSFHRMQHPAIEILKDIAFSNSKLITSSVLKYIQKNKSWAFIILKHVLPSDEYPFIPAKYYGFLDKQRKMWIKWGIDNKYLKKNVKSKKMKKKGNGLCV